MQDTKHHILVIEDDERLLNLLLQFLNSKAYRSTGAGSVEEARERMKGTFFDAFVVMLCCLGKAGWILCDH